MAQEETLVSSTVKPSDAPLVFISHDSRDASLAEAFSRLLRSVSAGMLKSFRSSDKKGTEGIEFGDEWYKKLMEKLTTASDVVCLLTERSLDRPWILYEAGVAKGKLETPVHGLALGVPLARVSGSGPFYQFQNSDDSEDSLKKLVVQLCKRVPGLEPDEGVIEAQVLEFKKAITGALQRIAVPATSQKAEVADVAGAKVLEEMKSVVRELSVRLDHSIAVGIERGRPRRRTNPGMLMELAERMSKRTGNPSGLLVLTSPLRDEFPWVYDLALIAYNALVSGQRDLANRSLDALREALHLIVDGPFGEELSGGHESRVWRELPYLLEHFLTRIDPEITTMKRKPITGSTRPAK